MECGFLRTLEDKSTMCDRCGYWFCPKHVNFLVELNVPFFDTKHSSGFDRVCYTCFAPEKNNQNARKLPPPCNQ